MYSLGTFLIWYIFYLSSNDYMYMHLHAQYNLTQLCLASPHVVKVHVNAFNFVYLLEVLSV